MLDGRGNDELLSYVTILNVRNLFLHCVPEVFASLSDSLLVLFEADRRELGMCLGFGILFLRGRWTRHCRLRIQRHMVCFCSWGSGYSFLIQDWKEDVHVAGACQDRITGSENEHISLTSFTVAALLDIQTLKLFEFLPYAGFAFSNLVAGGAWSWLEGGFVDGSTGQDVHIASEDLPGYSHDTSAAF